MRTARLISRTPSYTSLDASMNSFSSTSLGGLEEIASTAISTRVAKLGITTHKIPQHIWKILLRKLKTFGKTTFFKHNFSILIRLKQFIANSLYIQESCNIRDRCIPAIWIWVQWARCVITVLYCIAHTNITLITKTKSTVSTINYKLDDVLNKNWACFQL